MQIAFEQTLTAMVTNTHTPESTNTTTETPTLTPTNTPTQTSTSTETPTQTNTITPSLTPDLRVIELEPVYMQLQRDDLPKDGKYYLPNSTWTSPHLNSEVVSGWGVEEGKDYLAKPAE